MQPQSPPLPPVRLHQDPRDAPQGTPRARPTMIARHPHACLSKTTRLLPSSLLIIVFSSIFFFVSGLYVGQVILHIQQQGGPHHGKLTLQPLLYPFDFTASTRHVAPNQPRLALCISGNARTFHYNMVHGAILEKVLYPLANFTHVDVFFNIKLEDNPRPGFQTASSNVNSTRAAMARFNPVVVHEIGEQPNELEGLIGDDRMDKQYDRNGKLLKRLFSKPTNCSADPAARAYVPYALHRTQQCLPLVRKYEKAYKVQYTYFYRTRPDFVFLDNVPMPTVLSPRLIVGNMVPGASTRSTVLWWQKTQKKSVPDFGDHFLASLREDVDVAFNAANAVQECDLFNTPILRNPESILMFWLLKSGLTPVTPHVGWVLVREDIGPECVRIPQFRLPNSLQMDDMMAKCKHYEQKCNWTQRSSR